MLTALVFVVILGILIFVHELGHFIVARRSGIRAEEFGFGFPPRAIGVQPWKDKDGKKKWRLILGKRNTAEEWKDDREASEGTIYSLNWFPLGGFVRIKGENGEAAGEPDSFATKSPWVRIKVLAAGVTMNFILAWLVVSLALTIGAPQEVDNARGYAEGLKIQISEVKKGTPADAMGLKIGDQVIGCVGDDPVCEKDFTEVGAVQEFIRSHKGEEITLGIKRGAEFLRLSGVPRTDHPSDEGALGIGLAQTAIVSYPWYQALVEGIIVTLRMMTTIFVVFYELIRNLILGHPLGVAVSGPVGIYQFTGQVVGLGFVYILNFIALLSVNLGVINILPIPALDGGRIIFILIEKFKGSPVSQKVEHTLHTAGFLALMGLMLFITVLEVFNIFFRN